MSRYEIPARKAEHRVVVGWDLKLATYFVQVTECQTYMEDETDLQATIEMFEVVGSRGRLLLWEGIKENEITTVAQLQRLVASYAEWPDDLARVLEREAVT